MNEKRIKELNRSLRAIVDILEEMVEEGLFNLDLGSNSCDKKTVNKKKPAKRSVPEGFLTIEQVAEHYSVTPRAIYRWIKAGKISAIKPGKEYRIKKSELDRLDGANKEGK